MRGLKKPTGKTEVKDRVDIGIYCRLCCEQIGGRGNAGPHEAQWLGKRIRLLWTQHQMTEEHRKRRVEGEYKFTE